MKLIKTEDKFILVSDEEIKEGDWCIATYPHPTEHYLVQANNIVLGNVEHGKQLLFSHNNLTHEIRFCKKIIAGIPELPSIDFSLLSEEDCKTIGWVDVEKLADSLVNKVLLEEGKYWNDQDAREPVYYGIIEGFKSAQSLNDKRFSLEDMAGLLKYEYNNPMTGDYKTVTKNYIQSLQQTSWDVEVEMEEILPSNGNVHDWNKPIQPKITNNSIRIVKIM